MRCQSLDLFFIILLNTLAPVLVSTSSICIPLGKWLISICKVRAEYNWVPCILYIFTCFNSWPVLN